ncbi:hypothetical protein MIT9_P1470 [Methylomarinovum caldicuralii]|uniref:Uncharacterized protein n=1 Tax=Methylomarinovum caldicuralii TaxID=438856 RepID=A0AAU9BSM4_9GAMM|nr:hypothetical protein [Methylomarinovum caldicuralii]BCX81888.1 hypothetical protein MIT9_P1470 [Methylomarinovum caldicuralii]
MTQSLQALKTHRDTEDRQAFNEVLRQFLPQLRPYVAARLRYAEHAGLIPPRMYFPSDIVDEIYLEVFEHFSDADLDPKKLKIRLFKLADAKLEKILKEEARWQERKVPIEDIVREELKSLEEIFYPEEMLDDIEYRQDEYRPKLLLLEEGFEGDLLDFLELDRSLRQEARNRQLLARAYESLPPLSRIILELKVNGNLTVEEIADVREMDVEEVEAGLEAVKRRFRQALGQEAA